MKPFKDHDCPEAHSKLVYMMRNSFKYETGMVLISMHWLSETFPQYTVRLDPSHLEPHAVAMIGYAYIAKVMTNLCILNQHAGLFL